MSNLRQRATFRAFCVDQDFRKGNDLFHALSVDQDFRKANDLLFSFVGVGFFLSARSIYYKSASCSHLQQKITTLKVDQN